MRAETGDYFLNPPPGSAAERAAEFGIDLTLTLENLRLTPEDGESIRTATQLVRYFSIRHAKYKATQQTRHQSARPA